ncbi:MAG: hypothetical protein QM723_14905 [Myxococcaceae bacterium]
MTPAQSPLSTLGPPGHEHLPLLPAPEPEDDVRNRALKLPPKHVERAARDFAEALFCNEAGEPPDADRLDWVARDLMDFMARSAGRAGLILRLALFALTFLAPLFVFRPVPLGWLSVRRRVIALERMEASPLAPAALAVKAILCIIWFEHSATRAETHTPATCLKGEK